MYDLAEHKIVYGKLSEPIIYLEVNLEYNHQYLLVPGQYSPTKEQAKSTTWSYMKVVFGVVTFKVLVSGVYHSLRYRRLNTAKEGSIEVPTGQTPSQDLEICRSE